MSSEWWRAWRHSTTWCRTPRSKTGTDAWRERRLTTRAESERQSDVKDKRKTRSNPRPLKAGRRRLNWLFHLNSNILHLFIYVIEVKGRLKKKNTSCTSLYCFQICNFTVSWPSCFELKRNSLTPSGHMYPLQHWKWAVPLIRCFKVFKRHIIDISVFLNECNYNKNILRHIFG